MCVEIHGQKQCVLKEMIVMMEHRCLFTIEPHSSRARRIQDLQMSKSKERDVAVNQKCDFAINGDMF
jgi:hypothetical protein